jgi:hypothetical protein
MPERRQLPFDPIAEAQRQWEMRTNGRREASAMAVVTSIMRLQQIFLSKADSALRPLDLTFARYEVMMLLSFSTRGVCCLSGKIGERLQLNAASVTNAVDRLESQGLVAKQRPNPTTGGGPWRPHHGKGRRVAGGRLGRHERPNVFSDLGLDGIRALRALFGTLAKLRSAAGDFDRVRCNCTLMLN